MKKGKYNFPEKTYHPVFGELVTGQVYELPDDWNFEKQSLFEKVEVEPAKHEEKPRVKK